MNNVTEATIFNILKEIGFVNLEDGKYEIFTTYTLYYNNYTFSKNFVLNSPIPSYSLRHHFDYIINKQSDKDTVYQNISTNFKKEIRLNKIKKLLINEN